ncbi:MAG: hypothetical protein GY697_24945 [Desulfobacterales bacterium]|nr:hypothetical protein [Desulfobacterales bacterium]
MKLKINPVSIVFWIVATPVFLSGFIGLFTRSLQFKLPYISDHFIRALDQYTVYGQTLKGRAAIVRGEHWFFLITIGIVLVLAIVTVVIKTLWDEE